MDRLAYVQRCSGINGLFGGFASKEMEVPEYASQHRDAVKEVLYVPCCRKTLGLPAHPAVAVTLATRASAILDGHEDSKDGRRLAHWKMNSVPAMCFALTSSEHPSRDWLLITAISCWYLFLRQALQYLYGQRPPLGRMKVHWTMTAYELSLRLLPAHA